MPSRRRIQLAVPFVSLITGVNSIENSTCGPATTRAVASGLATARYCGDQLAEHHRHRRGDQQRQRQRQAAGDVLGERQTLRRPARSSRAISGSAR